MLDYYVKFFPTVEINSTYYRIPHPAVFANMVKKAPEGFDFTVKVPQSFTHRRTDIESDVRFFSEAVKPLVESGMLAGLLAQFPYSFKFSQDGLDYLNICRDAVAPSPLFVEFRHNGWVNRQMYDHLRAEKIGYVCVDEPELPGLLAPDAFSTTDTAYVRLHGRNAAKWWDGGSLRYDYTYSKEELNLWREKVRKLMEKTSAQYVFFNNCHLGQAVNNAREFTEMMSK
ncbi:MAG: DUF72 domain-containing protein [Candidatus Zixiibacteriota bacterium]|nr:MAG: DUF72 domain-containing protein [candidate division Zixibacteria bacterium]